jgi:hypothetical protein
VAVLSKPANDAQSFSHAVGPEHSWLALHFMVTGGLSAWCSGLGANLHFAAIDKADWRRADHLVPRLHVCPLVTHRSGPAELDLPQGQCQRHGRERDQHQHQKGVHIAEVRGLRLYLLSNPLNRLLLSLP